MISIKSQMYSIDFLVSGIIFILLFLTVVMFWDGQILSFQKHDTQDELKLNSRYALESLLNTKGSPDNWTETSFTDMSSIGLSSGRYGYLNHDKVKHLMNSNESYENIKNLLGMAGYEFTLNMTIYDSHYEKVNEAKIGYEKHCDSTINIYRLVTDISGRIYKLQFQGCHNE